MKRATWFQAIGVISTCAWMLSGCGGSTEVSRANAGECTPSAGTELKFVADSITVPKSYSEYALDLDGNGRPDNQLGNIVSALSMYFDTQKAANDALSAGSLVFLMKATSKDASFQSDDCAGVSAFLGKSTMNPDFTGNGRFETDPGVTGGTFHGSVSGGAFKSANPATASNPVQLTIRLPLVAGAQPLDLSVTAGHIQFKKNADGKITGGQIHGAVRAQDIQTQIIPTVVALLNEKVSDPNDANTGNILMLFDKGGTEDAACGTTCKNPDGSCAKKDDKKIDLCEVSTSSLIGTLLGPDVQLFAEDGSYHPTKGGMKKDSLSLGLAFTAVPASF